jgi:multiple sugar transport system permease protein
MIIYLRAWASSLRLTPALEGAARLDGARGWQILPHVILPQLWSAHFIVAMVCVLSALRSFDLVATMTRGGPYDSSNVLAFYMYEQAFLSLRYGYMAQ